MNNILKLILIACVAYGGYTWFNKSADTELSNWTTHQFELENIQVMFPAKPKSEKKSFQGVNMEFSGAHKSKAEYSVFVANGKEFLEGDFYPHSLVDKGALVEESRDISVNGYSCQEYKLSFENRTVIQRFIKYHSSLVTQTIMFNDNHKTNGSVDKFLASLVMS